MPDSGRTCRRSAYDAATALLTRRERSRHELAQSLEKRGHEAEEIATALERLRDDGYQSDQRFAEILARTRVAQGYGPQRIRAELRSHQLAGALIAECIAASDTNWTTAASVQLQRRYGVEPPVDYADRARRAQFLLRRGFDAATVSAVTRAAIGGTDDAED